MTDPSAADVRKAVEKYLQVKVPDGEGNLFDLGVLDSLQSVGLILDLEKSFEVKLSVLDLADNDQFTFSALALMIARRRAQGPRQAGTRA